MVQATPRRDSASEATAVTSEHELIDPQDLRSLNPSSSLAYAADIRDALQ